MNVGEAVKNEVELVGVHIREILAEKCELRRRQDMGDGPETHAVQRSADKFHASQYVTRRRLFYLAQPQKISRLRNCGGSENLLAHRLQRLICLITPPEGDRVIKNTNEKTKRKIWKKY